MSGPRLGARSNNRWSGGIVQEAVIADQLLENEWKSEVHSNINLVNSEVVIFLLT